jgi:hypothetical protein
LLLCNHPGECDFSGPDESDDYERDDEVAYDPLAHIKRLEHYNQILQQTLIDMRKEHDAGAEQSERTLAMLRDSVRDHVTEKIELATKLARLVEGRDDGLKSMLRRYIRATVRHLALLMEPSDSRREA